MFPIIVLAKMNGSLDLAMIIVDTVLLFCLFLIVILEHDTSESHCFVYFVLLDAFFEYAWHLAIYLRYSIPLPCIILKCTQVVIVSDIGLFLPRM